MQLLARQVGQLVDGIDVVKAVPVLPKDEPAGELRLQLGLLLRRQADEGEGHAVGLGVRLGRVQRRGQRARAHGEQVAQAGAAQHLHQQAVAHPGDLLGIGGGPEVNAREIVFTGPAALFGKQVDHPLAVAQLRAFEGIHKNFLF